MLNTSKSPYKGQLFSIFFLILPPAVLTGIFYLAIMTWNPELGFELNFASAKMLGCGLGTIFHLSCWLAGAFKKDIKVIKSRFKEFFSDLTVSPSFAFKWYLDDIKENGAAFWIDFAIMVINAWICVAATVDFFKLMEIRF